jgi:hypothetical protein
MWKDKKGYNKPSLNNRGVGRVGVRHGGCSMSDRQNEKGGR